MAELSVKVDEETASETVWKAQGKTRPGIDDSIAVGTAQVLKVRLPTRRNLNHRKLVQALESNLILKTSDHLHKVLAVLFSPVEGISKSDPKNHNAIFASLDTAKRFVWSIWPRATAPSLLTHEPPHNFGMLSEEDQKRIIDYSPDCGVSGKVAGNGLLIWGETMFDVYTTYRIPGVGIAQTLMAGSKLARWMREKGTSDDVELSKDRLEWAEEIEGDPKVLLPVDVRGAVRKWEKEAGWRGGREQDVLPFGDLRPPKLQHRIPLHRLPKKLIVHDPFKLLTARKRDVARYKEKDPSTLDWPSPNLPPTTNSSDRDADAEGRQSSNSTAGGSTVESKNHDTKEDERTTDIIHTYTLKLSKAGEKRVAEELERLSSLKCEIRELVRAVQKNPHTSTVRTLLKKFRCGLLEPPFWGGIGETYTDAGEQIRRVLKTGEKEKTGKWVFIMYGLPEWLKSENGDENAEDGEGVGGKPKVNDGGRVDANAEAHVYISAKHNLGVGNHSIVWDVDCDLPRETIFDGSIFPMPTWEGGFGGRKRRYPDLEIVEDNGALDNTTVGDEDYQDVVDGKEEYRVCKECVAVKAMEMWEKVKADMNGDQTEDDKSGYLERISDPGLPPLWESCDPLADPASKANDEPQTTYLLDAGRPARSRVQYEGPVHLIDTGVGWQDLRFPTCPHFEATKSERFGALLDQEVREVSGRGSCVMEVWGMESADYDGEAGEPDGVSLKPRKDRVPTHARVRLTAKLSIEDDRHLKYEAENYESFPLHFFERWSGFNICRPIQEPVPVGAIVPQYYGYYVPIDERGRRVASGEGGGSREDGDEIRLAYRSPIMLLEYCGEQISPSEMSIDDRREAASLFHRMHEEWWVHSSPYPRNILVQEDACEGGSYASDLHLTLSPRTNAPYKRFVDGSFMSFLPTDSDAEVGLFQSWVREKTMMRPKKSFRLIDFGRSDVEPDANRKLGWRKRCDIVEEISKVQQLFRLGFYGT